MVSWAAVSAAEVVVVAAAEVECHGTFMDSTGSPRDGSFK